MYFAKSVCGPDMDSFSIQGHVDDQHRLSAIVPGSVPAGPVTVWIGTRTDDEDEAGPAWMAGIGDQWADELNDPREDLYTLCDGEPVDPA
jgi:hypothetical protein